MTKFIQLHLLTAFSAVNLNRDDTGAPKSVVVGGVNRMRVSSQCLKRAWRTSEVFEEKLSGYIGSRTVRIGTLATELLMKEGVEEKKAIEWGKQIAEACGKAKKSDKKDPMKVTETEQLVFFTPAEIEKVKELALKLAKENRAPNGDELNIFSRLRMATDIALFGRMLASKPEFNVEAACQVAHAIGVSSYSVEDDFFTAVDDLKENIDSESGAGHLGELAFGSALFYSYICIDYDLLVKNLNQDAELAKKAIRALGEAAATVTPTGKQNSFASRAYASWALAEIGEFQPRSLVSAFYRPISGPDVLNTAISRIEQARVKFNEVYGQETKSISFNAETGQGTLKDLLDFITE